MSDDEASQPRCSRVACVDEGRWGVVLLLVPSRTYLGRPWRFRTSAVVCSGHKEGDAQRYLTDSLWKQILDFVDASKRPRPHRLSTRVDFVSLLNDDEAN